MAGVLQALTGAKCMEREMLLVTKPVLNFKHVSSFDEFGELFPGQEPIIGTRYSPRIVSLYYVFK